MTTTIGHKRPNFKRSQQISSSAILPISHSQIPQKQSTIDSNVIWNWIIANPRPREKQNGHAMPTLLLGLAVGYMSTAWIYDKMSREPSNPPAQASDTQFAKAGQSHNSLKTLALRAAKRHSIPSKLWIALVTAESNWQPSVVSHAGAVGLAQIMPATGKQFCGLSRVDLLNATKNLDCGASYLAHLKKRTGNWKQAVQSYNAGYRRVVTQGIIPKETVTYVSRIRKFGGNI